MCNWMGARLVWAVSNFIVFVCMASTAIISLISVHDYSGGIEHVIGASEAIKVASLVVFVLLGFPLAVSEALAHLNYFVALPVSFFSLPILLTNYGISLIKFLWKFMTG